MFDLDATTLARIQFALNISFHILFPTITIGLAWLLLFFRARFTITRNEAWEYAYYFWVKIFALTFALGVVSGVTMSFQFGTNWPGFIERAGNISGPLLGYEVLTAFFIEATFLAIMLFGKDRVSNRVHLTRVGARRSRHDAVGILDPEPELVDADAAGPRDRRRHVLRRRLARRDLQPVVPVSLRAHDDGLAADGGVPDRGRQRRAHDPARRRPRDGARAEDRASISPPCWRRCKPCSAICTA